MGSSESKMLILLLACSYFLRDYLPKLNPLNIELLKMLFLSIELEFLKWIDPLAMLLEISAGYCYWLYRFIEFEILITFGVNIYLNFNSSMSFSWLSTSIKFTNGLSIWKFVF